MKTWVQLCRVPLRLQHGSGEIKASKEDAAVQFQELSSVEDALEARGSTQ